MNANVAFLVMCLLSCIWMKESAGSNECNCRLSNSIIPQHYNVEIITYLENNTFTFDGRVSIKIRCQEATKKIVLHSKDLKLEEKSIQLIDLTKNATLKIDNFTYDKENDFFMINIAENLAVNSDYVIFIPYSGELKESGMEGFYRSSYIDQKTNEVRWVAVTQLAATSARMAFPCFDEPAMKAIFKISLGRAKKYTSISNMPIASTKPIENKLGWFWDHYEETVLMSTYLVAFVIVDFDYVSKSTTHGTAFKVWAKHDAISQVELAIATGPKCLEYYEEFFNVSYPLPKLDMVGIADFGAGGMENWGLIIFSESNLFYDVATSAASQQTFTAQVIAHEVAHQWFGNLVTMKWWTDLWLNEGFATYMANVAIQHVYPEWNIFTPELVSTLLSVFDKDSLNSSHPVSVLVNNPLEIGEIFDEISYDKGSYLINMMVNFLGADTFRKGISNYLRKHNYSNAEQDDLWLALTEQAHSDNALPKNLNVKTIMDTWTLQTGYPVLTVIRNYHSNSAKLKQERYLRNTNKTAASSSSCWWIPITYTTEKKLNFNVTRPDSWYSCPKRDRIVHSLPGSDKWVIFNLQAAGLYRVNYDEKNWNLLTTTLNCDLHNRISFINKVQLIDDSANLAWSGYINYKIYFDILGYLKQEDNYLPWRAAFVSIQTLEKMLKRTTSNGTFKSYMKQLLSSIYKRVGGFKIPENADFNMIKHQVQITLWGCKFDVGGCTDEAKKLFNKWRANPEKNSIPKDLRSIVYCSALKVGGEEEWNFLWQQYLASTSTAERDTILGALGCTEKVSLLQRYLEWAITINSGIRVQDSVGVIQAVAANDAGYNITKSFIQTRIKDIHQYLSALIGRLASVISTLASQMTTSNEYNEFKQFAETQKEYLLENKQAMEQAFETIMLNIQWQANHFNEIKKLLPEYIK